MDKLAQYRQYVQTLMSRYSKKVLDGSLATKFGCIPAEKPNSASRRRTPINSARVTGWVGLKVPS
ncbi:MULTISPECIES: hypothetical protein [unclassified Microcoleus]|uniref:hypothetical protein n=2 Tax=Microcoleus TaxID=44471 RepID=UPI002FD34283